MNATKTPQQTGTAAFIRRIDLVEWANQTLYRVEPPIQSWDGNRTHDFVIVSTTPGTTVDADGTCRVQTETYLFGADEHGNFIGEFELEGSQRDCDSHRRALATAGYTLTSTSAAE